MMLAETELPLAEAQLLLSHGGCEEKRFENRVEWIPDCSARSYDQSYNAGHSPAGVRGYFLQFLNWAGNERLYKPLNLLWEYHASVSKDTLIPPNAIEKLKGLCSLMPSISTKWWLLHWSLVLNHLENEKTTKGSTVQSNAVIPRGLCCHFQFGM